MRLHQWIRFWLVLLATCATTAYGQDELELDDPGDQMATAIDSGSVATVRRMLDEGASPNTLVYDSPAVMWAIWDERFYVVKLLVDRGADVNLPDTNGYTALMAACDMSNQRIANFLLANGADVNAVELTYGMSALQSACEAGDEEIVDLLIARGADVEHIDKYGGNCLEEAACYGHQAIVEKLRGKGLSTNWPLHVACGLGDVEQVRKLLAEGAKADEPNDGWKNTPMHFAACGGHVDVAKLLLEHGATLDAKNVLDATPLHGCAGADKPKVAKWLIEQGVDVNAPDADGNTPLDWAVEEAYDLIEENGGEHSALDFEEEQE